MNLLVRRRMRGRSYWESKFADKQKMTIGPIYTRKLSIIAKEKEWRRCHNSGDGMQTE